jgi:hypothetical protein
MLAPLLLSAPPSSGGDDSPPLANSTESTNWALHMYCPYDAHSFTEHGWRRNDAVLPQLGCTPGWQEWTSWLDSGAPVRRWWDRSHTISALPIPASHPIRREAKVIYTAMAYCMRITTPCTLMASYTATASCMRITNRVL